MKILFNPHFFTADIRWPQILYFFCLKQSLQIGKSRNKLGITVWGGTQFHYEYIQTTNIKLIYCQLPRILSSNLYPWRSLHDIYNSISLTLDSITIHIFIYLLIQSFIFFFYIQTTRGIITAWRQEHVYSYKNQMTLLPQ
jgi:hypothetical protein